MDANTIPGYIQPTHQTRLADTVKNLEPGSTILEVGCGFGRSTWVILDNMPKDCVLHTVDTYTHLDPEEEIKRQTKWHSKKGIIMGAELSINLDRLKQMGQKGYWDWLIAQHPKFKSVTGYAMRCQDYIEKYPDRKYNCVYLDGDHRYVAVKQFMEHWCYAEVICGDDYTKSDPGVVQAVNEFIAKYPSRTWYPPIKKNKDGFWCIKKHS